MLHLESHSVGLVDITHTVRIQCAHLECEEVDLCPNCFSEGKEVQSHKAWHDYKVVVSTGSSCLYLFAQRD